MEDTGETDAWFILRQIPSNKPVKSNYLHVSRIEWWDTHKTDIPILKGRNRQEERGDRFQVPKPTGPYILRLGKKSWLYGLPFRHTWLGIPRSQTTLPLWLCWAQPTQHLSWVGVSCLCSPRLAMYTGGSILSGSLGGVEGPYSHCFTRHYLSEDSLWCLHPCDKSLPGPHGQNILWSLVEESHASSALALCEPAELEPQRCLEGLQSAFWKTRCGQGELH